jgi:hypothetical protein
MGYGLWVKSIYMTKWKFKKILEPIPIDENMPDLSNDPYVLAKMEKAEKLIAEYGLPESFKTKAKSEKSVKVQSPKPKAKRGTSNA